MTPPSSPSRRRRKPRAAPGGGGAGHQQTKIAVAVDLDRAPPGGRHRLPFYDHMLDQVSAHADFSMILSCEGDLDVDGHHSIEDCAIAFGTALARALGSGGASAGSASL